MKNIYFKRIDAKKKVDAIPVIWEIDFSIY